MAQELKAKTIVPQGSTVTLQMYPKGEVDAVLAEKDEVIVELKKQVHDYAQGLYVMQARSEKEIRNQKYKRCLAMAKWCEDRYNYLSSLENWQMTDKEYRQVQGDYWIKWSNRWLELAEKFKETK